MSVDFITPLETRSFTACLIALSFCFSSISCGISILYKSLGFDYGSFLASPFADAFVLDSVVRRFIRFHGCAASGSGGMEVRMKERILRCMARQKALKQDYQKNITRVSYNNTSTTS